MRRKAIELDPKLVEAHELLASLALEDGRYEGGDGRGGCGAGDWMPDALDAMAIHAAAELLADRTPDVWLAKDCGGESGVWRGVCDRGAHDLELHYRYEDGIAYYRKAIEADPKLWSAHSAAGDQSDADGARKMSRCSSWS